MTQLTAAQRTTLLAAVKANATAAGYRTAGDSFSLLAWCNGAATPASLAWRCAVAPSEADEAATYTTFDSLVAGKRESWSLFLGFTRSFCKAKVRGWITDVWGAATAASISEAILLVGTENATNAQVALGGVSRTTGTVTALDRTFIGNVDSDDVNWLINAP